MAGAAPALLFSVVCALSRPKHAPTNIIASTVAEFMVAELWFIAGELYLWGVEVIEIILN